MRFPEVWTKRSGDSVIAFADVRKFVVRRTRASSGELLFGMQGSLPGDYRPVYSDQFYAVSLNGEFSVRGASSDEWNDAEELINTRDPPPENPFNTAWTREPHTEGDVHFAGKHFAKTGKFWPSPIGLVSPNQQWLAVFSYSSRHKPRRSWSILDGGGLLEPRHGKMFVDVYDTWSGARIQTARTLYRNCPSCFFSAAFWAGENYLVVPCGPFRWRDIQGQACLLGILPSIAL